MAAVARRRRAPQQPKARVEVGRDLGRSHDRHARGRQLDRERDAVEPATDLVHRRGVRRPDRRTTASPTSPDRRTERDGLGLAARSEIRRHPGRTANRGARSVHRRRRDARRLVARMRRCGQDSEQQLREAGRHPRASARSCRGRGASRCRGGDRRPTARRSEPRPDPHADRGGHDIGELAQLMLRRRARRTKHRRRSRRDTSFATWIASRVLPTPPAPVIVTNGSPATPSATPPRSLSRPTNEVSCDGRLPANVPGRIDRPALETRDADRAPRSDPARPCRRRCPRRLGPHRQIAGTDRPFERAKLGAGCQAQLRERRAGALVGPQCLGLLAAPVQRQHEQRPPALAEGLLGNQCCRAAPESSRCLPQASSASANSSTTQRCCSSKRAASHRPGCQCSSSTKRLPPPQIDCRRQRARRPLPIPRLAPAARPSATSRSKRRTSTASSSARRTYPPGRVAITLAAQHLSQPHHEVLDDLRARARWLIAPQRLDEPIAARRSRPPSPPARQERFVRFAR